jgi:ElaB/YqjD/DUF883 family membrane-anchored ribosome-binding protein
LDIKEIQKDFERRIDAIRAELVEKGPEASGMIEKSLDELKESLEEKLAGMFEGLDLDEARKSVEDALETGRSAVQERPLTAVGVAVLVGIIIGLLAGPKGKD